MARYLVVVLSSVMMAATVALTGACGMQPGGTQQQVGKMQEESKSVDLKNAEAVRAQLKMGAGELHITGGADQLMEGEFSYNISEWKPKVSYDVSGGEGELLVKQGSANSGSLGAKARNAWDISFNEEVPTDLVVKMGAGESDLDLDSLTLKGVDLKMGAGKSTIDLTGDYAQSFDASIQGGVGEATVLVPSEVGVRVKAEGGLGKINAEGFQREGEAYVNDTYGDSDVTLDVDVRGGVGQINLEVV
jgi:N-terminal domain of toast_rack, DUF2154